MDNQATQLKKRTKPFAIRIIRMLRALPKTDEARVISRQLLRAATSVAANYRAVCRARSTADFVAKMGLVVEEADETVFWLELLADAGIVQKARLEQLERGANELLAIFAASQRTVKRIGRSMSQ
jgi:four helix bundle protein